jgi:hypothetical protein
MKIYIRKTKDEFLIKKFNNITRKWEIIDSCDTFSDMRTRLNDYRKKEPVSKFSTGKRRRRKR